MKDFATSFQSLTNLTKVSSRVSAPPRNIDLIPFWQVPPNKKTYKSESVRPPLYEHPHPHSPPPQNFGELDSPPPSPPLKCALVK